LKSEHSEGVVTVVVTMLEAQVAPDHVGDLEHAYREGTAELPPDIVETFLVRDAAEPERYRIMTVWASREALERMRASGVTPRGVQIFQTAGAMPTLTVLEVAVHRDHAGDRR
jgi:heme-degrading monooxygenase HmoA